MDPSQSPVYTTGSWQPFPGHEDDFLAAWREFAGHIKANTASRS